MRVDCIIFIDRLPILCDISRSWLNWICQSLECATRVICWDDIIIEIFCSLCSSFLELYFLGLSFVRARESISCICFWFFRRSGGYFWFGWFFEIINLGLYPFTRCKCQWSLIHTDGILDGSTARIDEITIELCYLSLSRDSHIIEKWCECELGFTILSAVREPDSLVIMSDPVIFSVIPRRIVSHIHQYDRSTRPEILTLEYYKNNSSRYTYEKYGSYFQLGELGRYWYLG